jgi:hypothetical protein
MPAISRLATCIIILFLLSSCEFKCNVGNKDKTANAEVKKPVVKGGSIIYNGIDLESHNMKLSKAYLIFEDGTRVPEGNFVDFSAPIRLILLIDSGWVAQQGMVLIGASEKVQTENGATILDEKDLFEKYPEGVSVEDAKIIGLTVTLRIDKNSPPTSFTTSFKVWDKKGDGYIEGNYKLYSK